MKIKNLIAAFAFTVTIALVAGAGSDQTGAHTTSPIASQRANSGQQDRRDLFG